tara:strand:+ start:144 stop:272 length:129 start_codon:yes stop_codon:yes gene_type:complete
MQDEIKKEQKEQIERYVMVGIIAAIVLKKMKKSGFKLVRVNP